MPKIKYFRTVKKFDDNSVLFKVATPENPMPTEEKAHIRKISSLVISVLLCYIGSEDSIFFLGMVLGKAREG